MPVPLITYESIRQAHIAEKAEQLQKLPDSFFEAVKNWIENKRTQQTTESLIEIDSAKKIIQDIINRRQRKIVVAALHTVRGDLPPANLDLSEQKFFDQLVFLLKNNSQEIKEKFLSADEIVEEKISQAKVSLNSLEHKPFKPELSNNIRILEDIPEFLGTDGKPYGPFKAEQETYLPDQTIDILIQRKKGEKLENSENAKPLLP